MLGSRTLGANPALLCVFHALHMSLFPVAVITLFWKLHLGMSMTEIMLLQAFFGLVVAAFEFPSGYLADRIGYRRTLCAGAALAVAGWTAYASAGSIAGAILAEALLGVAFSLISGADSALLYESLLETGREDAFTRWYGRLRFCGQTAEGTSALVAGALFAASPRLPFVLEIGVWAIAVLVALRLAEPDRRRSMITDHRAHARGIVRHVTRESPRLLAVVYLTTAFGLASFVPVWLIQLYATGAGVPVAWLGPLWAVANYTVALTALVSDRVRARIGLEAALLSCVGLAVAGYVGLGLSEGTFGFAFYFLLTTMRGLNSPLLHHEEQRLIPSGDRASIISLRSLLFRGLFLVIGPLVGAGVDAYGQHPVLLASGGAFGALTLAGWVWLGRTRALPAPTPAGGGA